MSCNSPWFNQKLDPPSIMPCGFCAGCRADKVRLYEIAASYEMAKHRVCSFVTFTYRDTDLYPNLVTGKLYRPDMTCCATLNRKHFSSRLQVLREYVRTKLPSFRDYSFIINGEYGDSFNRPHHHAVFFGLDFDQEKLFSEVMWKDGDVQVLPVTPGAIRYVIKYFEKQLPSKESKIIYDELGLERPFVQVSPGFGSDLYAAHAKEINETGRLFVNGYALTPPPRYRQMYRSMEHLETYDSVLSSHFKYLSGLAAQQGMTLDEYLLKTRYDNELAAQNNTLAKNEPVYTRVLPPPRFGHSSLSGDIRKLFGKIRKIFDKS